MINADSQQVYADLRILTARPTPADEAAAPHRLYGVLPAAEACPAERWRAMAETAIGAVSGEGRLPILVGGTGLYFRALVQGLAPVPDIAPEIREAARRHHAEIGGEAFRDTLAALDPEGAARLRPSDGQRLVRAYEVVRSTGKTLAEWQAMAAPATPRRFAAILLMPARLDLMPAIGGRLRRMAAEGAVEEVRALLAQGLAPDLPAMKAVGVPEIRDFLEGRVELEATLTAAEGATGRYAKRQLTWFRHQATRDFPDHLIVREQYSERVLAKIFSFLRRFSLTG